MVHKWKLDGLYPVDAGTAGEELNRIYEKYGALKPQEVVNESRDASAPLHPCFEWNDDVAAEKYRVIQAGDIIRAVIAVPEQGEAPADYRAFVHVEESYHPITVVIKESEKLQNLMASALKELSWFKKKYEKLEALKPVFEAIDAISA